MSQKTQLEDVNGYQIKEAICFDDNRGFALAENKKTNDYVTWQFTVNDSVVDMYWGHYTENKETATMDYQNRVEEYRKEHPGTQEKYNHLAAAEMDEEDNCNMIDGIPNNSAKSTKQAQSILQAVQNYQQQPSKQNKENTESYRKERA